MQICLISKAYLLQVQFTLKTNIFTLQDAEYIL